MQRERGALKWAYVFFWCGALAAAIGFWTVARPNLMAASRLAPGFVPTLGVFMFHVAAAIRTVRRLPSVSTQAAQRQVLASAGVGLLLVSLALALR
jgi:hypothetical protein